MSQPLVIDYLKTHTLQELELEHGVVGRLNVASNKLSLNYDQILVKNGDPLAEQCRGMVVRPAMPMTADDVLTRVVGEVDVLAWPMDRFYNLGDASGADVWWSDPELRVYEKLDGTMIVMYYDHALNQWFTATRSVSEADLPINAGHIEIGDMTFSGLFRLGLETTWKSVYDPATADEILSSFETDLTYVFELTSQHNRIVVKYDEPRVTLLAARHTGSGHEVSIHQLTSDLHWLPRPKTWSLKDPEAIAAFVNEADPAALEGAVACDSRYRRLKIKNKAWVLSSRAKDLVTTSRRNAVEAMLSGTIDDVIPLVAEDIGQELLAMQDRLRAYLKRVDANFNEWKAEADGSRKRFAELVNLSGDWATPYFQLMDGKGQGALDWAVSSQAAGRLSPRVLDTLLEKIKG